MSSPEGKIYSIDDDARKKLELDPTQSEPIKKAFKRNELDSRFIRENVIPNAEPYKIESLQSSDMSNIDPSGTALVPSVTPASFFQQKNIPTPPSEPVISSSTPDIVEQGKSFFRKAKEGISGFFSQRV